MTSICVAILNAMRALTRVCMELQGGYAPLHIAAKHGHAAAVDLLLSNKAAVNAKSEVCAFELMIKCSVIGWACTTTTYDSM